MKRRENDMIPVLHRDMILFREALNYTAAETLFAQRLIEKDYFCTLLLYYLASTDKTLIFKGGTCLAKVHAGFYRLSEDLDFAISIPVISSRSERSRIAAGVKDAVAGMSEQSGVFKLIQPLVGANNSTQYIAVVAYQSALGDHEETIKIEVGLREPLLMPASNGSAQTLILDPVSGKAMIQPLSIPCLSFDEAIAEKFRAALSRRDPAIRDFYDIAYVARNLKFDPLRKSFLNMVSKKLAIPGNDPINISEERFNAIRQQLDARLKPVLRTSEFAEFDLESSFRVVFEVAVKLGETSKG
jgi:predicted nucleotidyltransferase component of viral defense system